MTWLLNVIGAASVSALAVAGLSLAARGGPDLMVAVTPVQADASEVPEPEPATQFETTGTSPGAAIAENVVFQECGETALGAYCAMHGQGRKLFAYQDGSTADEVMEFLNAQEPGAPLAIVGHITKSFDGGANVVMDLALPRAAGPHDRVLHQLQGQWYAAEDANAQFSILGAERQNVFQGAVSDMEYLSVEDSCGDFAGKGPYLNVYEPDTKEKQCFAIDSIDLHQMTLIFLPRGNFLQYRRME